MDSAGVLYGLRGFGVVGMSKKRTVVPVHKRTHVRDCEPGDRFRVENDYFECGEECCGASEFIASNWLNGGPMGREIVDGVEQELAPIDGSLRMELVI